MMPKICRSLRTVAAVTALTVAMAPALAAPKRRDAKVAFDRGVAAYSKKDYAAAATALAKSYALEADVETLYAWAQAERQQDHCDKAIELWDRLLQLQLPEENRKVVNDKRAECQAIIDAAKPPPEPPPKVEPLAEPEQAKPRRPPQEAPPPEPPRENKPAVASPSRVPKLLVIGVGVAGMATGGYFLKSSSSAASDAKAATNYFDAIDRNARADRHGKIGVAAVAGGGVVVAAGLVWWLTSNGGGETAPRTTIVPTRNGLAVLGNF